MIMRKITLPDWFKSLPMKANLNAMDIKHLLGYSQKTEVSQLIDDRSIPPPDWHCKGLHGGKGRPMWRWRTTLASASAKKQDIAIKHLGNADTDPLGVPSGNTGQYQ